MTGKTIQELALDAIDQALVEFDPATVHPHGTY